MQQSLENRPELKIRKRVSENRNSIAERVKFGPFKKFIYTTVLLGIAAGLLPANEASAQQPEQKTLNEDRSTLTVEGVVDRMFMGNTILVEQDQDDDEIGGDGDGDDDELMLDTEGESPAIVGLESGDFSEVDEILTEMLDEGVSPEAMVGKRINFALTWDGENLVDADGNLFELPAGVAGDMILQLVEDLEPGTALNIDFILESLTGDTESGISVAGMITMDTQVETGEGDDNLVTPVLSYVSGNGEVVQIEGTAIPADFSPCLQLVPVEGNTAWLASLGIENPEGDNVIIEFISVPTEDPNESESVATSVIDGDQVNELSISSVTTPQPMNVRSGPGTSFSSLGLTQRDQTFPAVAPWQETLINASGIEVTPENSDFSNGTIGSESWVAVNFNDTVGYIAINQPGFGVVEGTATPGPELFVENASNDQLVPDIGLTPDPNATLDPNEQEDEEPQIEAAPEPPTDEPEGTGTEVASVNPELDGIEPWNPDRRLFEGYPGVSIAAWVNGGVETSEIVLPNGEIIRSWVRVNWLDTSNTLQTAIVPLIITAYNENVDENKMYILDGSYHNEGFTEVAILRMTLRLMFGYSSEEIDAAVLEGGENALEELITGTRFTIGVTNFDAVPYETNVFPTLTADYAAEYSIPEINALQTTGNVSALASEITLDGTPILFSWSTTILGDDGVMVSSTATPISN